ncbi:hypothetical protein SV7mr_16370 [Stieleria bergensis]|uniref:Glycine zipper domain-containing protein n=1 Tax=Stieleria bergensis TaxID=2528025 RepID=A0A517SSN4_9BACT|nr:MAG: hypothetical protein CBB71_22475 [Rhodopirellula sp. TMED11]QDT59130.1 hypothetical protein SV7mr_16370 [Planctomycetes bacterium SV_7m_r]
MNYKTNLLVVAVIATSLLAHSSTAVAQVQKQRGAVMGGLAGAIAGGIIGDNSDKAGAGAAIGGVVGAVAGGILGDAADREQAYARQQSAYRYHQQQQATMQQQYVVEQSAVTLGDVVSMTRSGLSDHVITNQIRQRGYVGTVTVSDIIALHNQGVSENVITALQSAPEPQVNLAPPAQPTIIERHIHQPAPVIIERPVPVYRSYPRYHPARRQTIHFRF